MTRPWCRAAGWTLGIYVALSLGLVFLKLFYMIR